MTEQEAIEQAKELITTSIEKIERIVIAPLSLGELITAELRKALALLKQAEPPAGEFTNELRAMANHTSNAAMGATYLDCADRLDAQQQKNQELLGENRRLRKQVNDRDKT